MQFYFLLEQLTTFLNLKNSALKKTENHVTVTQMQVY